MLDIRSVERASADFQELKSCLETFLNSSHSEGVPAYSPQVFAFSSAEKGSVIGGLIGEILWDWFYVKLLAVAPAHRGKGVATALLERAELEAKKQNCWGIWVNTYSFQAPDFYERFGFREFGRLPNNPEGHDRIFLHKPF